MISAVLSLCKCTLVTIKLQRNPALLQREEGEEGFLCPARLGVLLQTAGSAREISPPSSAVFPLLLQWQPLTHVRASKPALCSNSSAVYGRMAGVGFF